MPGGRPTRPLPSLRFRRIRALALLVALVCVPTFGVHLIRAGLADASTPTAVRASTAPAAPVVPATAQSAAAALAEHVDRRNAGVRGQLSVAVADLGTGVSATYGPTEHVFATASIVKVDILATLLLQRQGQLTTAQKSVARRMIQESSNGAATTLWRQIGSAAGLEHANAQFGMTATVAGRRGTWGATTTTAADQLQLLRVVFTDQSPLTPESRRYLRSLMGGVVADQDWGVSAADTRSGSKYYVKNGWLPRTGGWVVNSIGSVVHDGHPLLIVALSDGRVNRTTGIKVAEQVARDAATAVTVA